GPPHERDRHPHGARRTTCSRRLDDASRGDPSDSHWDCDQRSGSPHSLTARGIVPVRNEAERSACSGGGCGGHFPVRNSCRLATGAKCLPNQSDDRLAPRVASEADSRHRLGRGLIAKWNTFREQLKGGQRTLVRAWQMLSTEQLEVAPFESLTWLEDGRYP